jgi:predicted esterase YcpF (UPF0227 family)
MVRRGIRLALMIGLATAACARAVRADGLSLVQGGRANSQIVVAEVPSKPAQAAAALLQTTIRKMTGADLPIVKESAAEAAPAAQRTWISIGHTRFARSKGPSPAALKPEEIRVVVEPSWVILLGNEASNDPEGSSTQWGTYYAVVEFLERLGVRWLWPGEIGEVIPRSAELVVPCYSYCYVPKLFQRHLRFQPPAQSAQLGEFLYQASIEKDGLGAGDWPEKMRLGHSRPIRATHSFGEWYERYFKAHPEYFATDEDGKSHGGNRNTQRLKQCLSNPGVQGQVVDLAVAYHEHCRLPQLAMYSLSPNDGQGHCLCPNCRAQDVPGAPPVEWNWDWQDAAGNWHRKIVKHVSLSDRHVNFWNQIAQRAEKQRPGLLFGAYAYGVYRDPPLRTDVHPNVVIGYVGMSYENEAVRRAGLEQWDGWARRTSAMFFRPNCMKEGNGFPLVYARRLAQDIRHFADHKMVAADIANIGGHYATQGLNYYVLCKILWNPAADPDAIIADYCQRGFGAGAGEIRQYLLRLMELSDQFAAYAGQIEPDVRALLRKDEATAEEEKEIQDKASAQASPWEVVFTPQAMAQLEAHLARARDAVQSDRDCRKRVEFLQEGFQYAQVALPTYQRLEYLKRHKDSFEARFAAVKALQEEEAWRRRHAQSNAVGIVTGVSWWHKVFRRTPIGGYFAAASATPAAGQPGAYDLMLPAWTSAGRIEKMQFSTDAKARTWSDPEPYLTTKRWQGTARPLAVRFLVTKPADRGKVDQSWSRKVEIVLNLPEKSPQK